MKRILCLILTVLLLTGCGSQEPQPQPTHPTATTFPTVETTASIEAPTMPEEPPLPQARQITEGFTVFLGEQDTTWYVTDGNVNTKVRIYRDDTLRIESTTPFAALYLVWDTIPGSYTLHWEGGSQVCGSYGFLHEYVTLEEPVCEVTLRLPPEGSALLCDVRCYTEGSVPEDVQAWQPPYTEADILVFPTHSDDDAIFFGALISYYAIERQLTVQTAFMVDHTWQPHRAHERLNGLWAMGIRHYPVLGSAPDTATFDFREAMSLYQASDILGWQVEQIRRFRPLVVVGHDLNGEYGNAGHKVNAHYLTQAITAAADPELYPDSCHDYGVWQAAKLYLHLYRENEIYLDVNTPMVNDPLGRTPFEAAQDGFAAHVSQQKWATVQQDDHNRAYDCRPFGLYFTLVGPDYNPDIMDHIDRETWNNREDD